MKTYVLVHLWSYLVQFILESEMFQTKFIVKIKTHIVLQWSEENNLKEFFIFYLLFFE
jgi:hypothetical protein